MVYLLVATLCSATIPIVMRFAEGKIKNEYGMYIFNYITCVFLSLAFMKKIELFPHIEGIENTLIIGASTGVLYLFSLYYYDLSVKKAGVVLTTIFRKSGIIIPVFIATIIFGEKITFYQLLGVMLSICAIVLVNYHKNSFNKINHIEILFIAMLTGGLAESTNNIFNKLGNSMLKDQYFFYIFLFATISTIAMLMITKKRIGKTELIFGVLLGIPNYFSTRFLTMALLSVSAVIAYPVFFMVSMVLITLFGVFVFKEKIDVKKVVAITIVIISMVLLNI